MDEPKVQIYALLIENVLNQKKFSQKIFKIIWKWIRINKKVFIMHVKVLSCRHLWYFMCFIYFHIWIWGSFGLLSHCDFIYGGWLIFWARDNYFMVVQSLTSLSFCNLHLWRGFDTRVVTVGVGISCAL